MDTLDQLIEARKKIYNPKTNCMIVINGPAYRKLLCDGYMHWREERLLILPLHELQILTRYLLSFPIVFGISYQKEVY